MTGAQAPTIDTAAVEERIEEVARLAVFGADADRVQARQLIRDTATALGARSASIAPLYAARGRGEVSGFTVPAVNIRGMTFDVARALFRAMHASDCAAAIFEINRAEIGFSFQEPEEFATVVLAAAIAEGRRGPVFIQGDHFQASAAAFAKDPETETAALEDLVRKAVAAGFGNIDIDASTLVDLGKEGEAAQQEVNARLTARLALLVRELDARGDRVSIGGEIGEVGAHNSTAAELRAYMDRYRDLVGADGPRLAKVSVQTGTTHGGVVLADGSMKSVNLDFATLEALGRIAREQYGMAGCVQHGASTLPEELFDRFPAVETAEVHLATGFQNLLMDHPAFPAKLLADMRRYCDSAFATERKPDETDGQFFYNTRKKAWGPFKRETWDLPPAVREELRGALQARFELLIRRLGVAGSRAMVERYVKR